MKLRMSFVPVSMFVCIIILAFGALHASAETYNAFTYYIGNGEISITGYSGAAKKIEIPSEISGLPVTSIGNNAFSECTNITSVILPDSVTRIGENAFADCRSLTSVTLGKGGARIGARAFYQCDKMETIYIKDLENYLNCQYLGDQSNPMAYAEKLYVNNKVIKGNLVIPDTVQQIPQHAFRNCRYLTGVTIPDSVTSIDVSAFYGSGLVSVTIPDSVVSIGQTAFSRCNGLTSIVLPDSVTSIGHFAFFECSELTSVTIPDSVTSIGYLAFSGCGKLANIALPNGITTIRERTFGDCVSLTEMTIPEGVTSIDKYAFSGCSGLTSVTLPDSVTSIDKLVFEGCDNLKAVYVKSLESYLNCEYFGNYSNPMSCAEKLYVDNRLIEGELVMPDTVRHIPNDAFNGCRDLTGVTFPDGVTIIGSRAFSGCSGLTSVVIPKSLVIIYRDAFDGCQVLSTVYYNGAEEEWADISISDGNEALTKATRIRCCFVTLIDSDGDQSFMTCVSGEKIDVAAIEEKYKSKVTLYTDAERSKVFDTSMPINGDLILYVDINTTNTTVSADGKTLTVKPVNVKTGSVVILALYDNGRLADMQSAVCDGADLVFATDAVYTEAKVMVWKNLSDLKPEGSVEIVK